MDPAHAKQVGDTIMEALDTLQRQFQEGCFITLMVRHKDQAPGQAWMITTEPQPHKDQEALTEEFRLGLKQMTGRGMSKADLGDNMATTARRLQAN